MKVQAKVISAKSKLLWYADRIGDIITIERETQDFYWAREPAGYINIVYKQDVEIVNKSSTKGTHES